MRAPQARTQRLAFMCVFSEPTHPTATTLDSPRFLLSCRTSIHPSPWGLCILLWGFGVCATRSKAFDLCAVCGDFVPRPEEWSTAGETEEEELSAEEGEMSATLGEAALRLPMLTRSAWVPYLVFLSTPLPLAELRSQRRVKAISRRAPKVPQRKKPPFSETAQIRPKQPHGGLRGAPLGAFVPACLGPGEGRSTGGILRPLRPCSLWPAPPPRRACLAEEQPTPVE